MQSCSLLETKAIKISKYICKIFNRWDLESDVFGEAFLLGCTNPDYTLGDMFKLVKLKFGVDREVSIKNFLNFEDGKLSTSDKFTIMASNVSESHRSYWNVLYPSQLKYAQQVWDFRAKGLSFAQIGLEIRNKKHHSWASKVCHVTKHIGIVNTKTINRAMSCKITGFRKTGKEHYETHASLYKLSPNNVIDIGNLAINYGKTPSEIKRILNLNCCYQTISNVVFGKHHFDSVLVGGS